ncbi:ATP-binding protein [Streptomyces lonegramiae]|uniref:ATP-binding protein n=1 Tax=Streptomyces lonegramiae TaxID=3075524 RepID=A0ABU2XTA1_9ACTN|nr:ATP-binding protein [Streptomyces sp. DSM 41529]MDT0548290.1 ATP-binding protein [Streptomyces sp. DSM 41529]
MPPSDSRLVSLVFPPEPVWVRAAREAVRTLLAAADRRDLADTALLLTSEAVTNSVNACLRSGCSTPVTLFAEWTDPHHLRVLVQDEAPGLPSPAHRRPQRTNTAEGWHSSPTAPTHGASARMVQGPARRHGSSWDPAHQPPQSGESGASPTRTAIDSTVDGSRWFS